uniref:26S proteasome complex subunit SEM1 n=1 Tax=Oryza punctata TaxID=4537 RepID=A0A0E0JHS4_ORYPU
MAYIYCSNQNGPLLTTSCINFGTSEWDDKEEGNEAVQQWEDDWDDDDVNDDFSLQLRKELESNPSKN